MVDFYFSFIIKVYLLEVCPTVELSGTLALCQGESNIKMKITHALTLVPVEVNQC